METVTIMHRSSVFNVRGGNGQQKGRVRNIKRGNEKMAEDREKEKRAFVCFMCLLY